jgi:hypothetical protein
VHARHRLRVRPRDPAAALLLVYFRLH